ncbi:MAG: thioredoxin domain-containing protein [Thiohalomonadales bacterium]
MNRIFFTAFFSIIISLFLSVGILNAASNVKVKNQLLNHASPYLAMHGTDPVNWQEWNAETVARAKKENKILFVSSGYFSCHWCHVMQRESYKNKEIATIINKYFIAVKVDRELSPALDAKLIDFAERTTGRAGWPLNVFVIPEGYPLVAMTYVPTKQFKDVLLNISSRWEKESKDLKQYAKDVADELHPVLRQSNPTLEKGLAEKYTRTFLLKTFDYADELQGGFGQSLKFPSAPQLSLLLKIQKQKPNPRLEKFLRLTLDQMRSQGLWDHIGGGFYRYVVDPAWQVPHFEKMLYNNALLAVIYFDAAKILKQPKYTQTAIATLEFMLRDLATESGAFAASLSAVDNNGVEGGFYVWTKEEIKKIASDTEFKIAELLWALDKPPALEHGYHLTQKMSVNDIAKLLKMNNDLVEKNIISLRAKLFNTRKSRSLPKDTKQLAAWNGLALSAFVKAAKQTGNDKYKKQAKKIKEYIENILWKKDHLLRAVNGKLPLGTAGLEDYAYVAQGFYDYAEYSKKASDMDLTFKVVTEGFKRFYTKYGWVLSENMLLQFGNGELLLTDGPMPSTASILAAVSLRVTNNKKDEKLKNMALSSLNVQSDILSTQPYWYATHVNAIAEYQLGW